MSDQRFGSSDVQFRNGRVALLRLGVSEANGNARGRDETSSGRERVGGAREQTRERHCWLDLVGWLVGWGDSFFFVWFGKTKEIRVCVPRTNVVNVFLMGIVLQRIVIPFSVDMN